MFQLVQVDSLILRLNAELARSAPPQRQQLDNGLIETAEADRIFDLDLQLLNNRVTEWNANRTHLQQAVDLVDVEIDVLKQQIELLKQEGQIQRTELEAARKLADQNLIPRPRLQEKEREASSLSRDLLDAQSFLARADQSRADREYELSSADTLWQLGIQGDLRTAMQEKSRLTAEVDVLRDKMLAAGMLLGPDGSALVAEPAVVIHRLVAGAPSTLRAALDEPIQSGDVIEVSISRLTQG